MMRVEQSGEHCAAVLIAAQGTFTDEVESFHI
jgi:hypothetical protein